MQMRVTKRSPDDLKVLSDCSIAKRLVAAIPTGQRFCMVDVVLDISLGEFLPLQGTKEIRKPVYLRPHRDHRVLGFPLGQMAIVAV